MSLKDLTPEGIFCVACWVALLLITPPLFFILSTTERLWPVLRFLDGCGGLIQGPWCN